MGKIEWKPGNMLYPLPAVLVTVADNEGRDNVFTVAWAGTVCTNPPMVSISVRPERYSYDFIKKTGEFTINLTTEAMTRAVDYCGVKSGRDVDKYKIKEALNNRQVWDEVRADEILNYYIPRTSAWDEENYEFYFFDNGMGWTASYNIKKYIKLKDRRFWRIHAGFWGGKIRDYLIDEFELEGFTKEIGETFDSHTEIIFKLNEEN